VFLTIEDLKTLTGYEHSRRQIGWLKSHGWRYAESRNGRPVVLAKHAEEMLSLTNQPRQAPKMQLAAIKKAA